MNCVHKCAYNRSLEFEEEDDGNDDSDQQLLLLLPQILHK